MSTPEKSSLKEKSVTFFNETELQRKESYTSLDTVEDLDDLSVDMVALVVSNTDDPTLPTLTFRFWVLGPLFTIVLSFVNQFFYYRETQVVVTILVAQLLSYPCGEAMARVCSPL